MFEKISKPVRDQMEALEEIDAQDRKDGTPHLKRLRQISPETGKFIAMMAAGTPDGAMLEIGTSGGYSALWLSLAAEQKEAKLVTFELLPDKVAIAKKTFKAAKVDKVIILINGDARGHVSDYEEVAFCFLDAEKEMYQEFYELIVPRLVPGGMLIADNVISHQKDLESLVDFAEADKTVDSLVVPLGKGLLVCQKV